MKPFKKKFVAAVCDRCDCRQGLSPVGAHRAPLQLGRLLLLPVLALFAPVKLFACATCYGASDSPMADGMNWGIFTLLGIVVPVLVSFLAFFIYLIRKSEALAKAAEKISPDA